MNRISRYIFLLIIYAGAVNASIAQERCGTVPYDKGVREEGALLETHEIFENWISRTIQEKKVARSKQGPYQVPVVVHVIHNGEPVGVGANIPDAQILSQLQVLNEDFKRLNADASETPAMFAPVAGSLDIEFVMAKQDPEGLATNGIVRVQGTKSSYSLEDNYLLKSESYWPAEDYINIWVANLNGYLGWAQLPVSNLPGLENSSENRLTDGIVIWHRAFGSIDHGAFNLVADFNKGRTATHEMGHFFGLKHIWGDDGGSCSGTDNVIDTPNQAGQTNGCPSHPTGDACTSAKMFQNFMDYSDDGCMNLFTEGQVDRMIAVLENSPRRASLITSHALNDPIPVANDLGIRALVTPQSSYCETTVTPVVEVRNYGSNNVTSATLSLSIDGSSTSKNFSMNLAPLETTQLSFDPVNLLAGTFNIEVEILQTNGTTDGNTTNNDLSSEFIIPNRINVPFQENFETWPPLWTIENPDQKTTWEIAFAPRDVHSNRALKLNHFNYADGFGEKDILYSPVFDLSSAPVATLVFYVAHARFGASFDRLQVVVLTDCQPLDQGTIVYDKAGNSLATAPGSGAFTPADAGQWRREQVDLNNFLGEERVQLAFVSISDFGNNLYLDNVSLIVTQSNDLALAEVVRPSPVTCSSLVEPVLRIQNNGTSTIDYFEVLYGLNGSPSQVAVFQNTNFEPGTSMDFVLPPIGLQEGPNDLLTIVRNPDGGADNISENDTIRYQIIHNTAEDRIPLREDFEGMFTGTWSIVNPQGGMNWEKFATGTGSAVAFRSFDNEWVGDQAWFVSPVLDFSDASEASMVFDVSSRRRSGNQEILDVLSSTDCGNTFEPVLNVALTQLEQNDFWIPNASGDWLENLVVNLNHLAGEKEARIAFRVTNKSGNNLFVDNVEFFTAAVPNLVETETPYSIYGYDPADPGASELKITFNLQERADVAFSITDVMGRTFANGTLQNVLNQTYPIEPQQKLTAGLYVIRLKIGDRYYAERILVSE